MSDHKERTRFSAELDEDIRKMSKDDRIIEQSSLDKVLAKAVQDYEEHGITHEVPEEERKKALEIMKEMGLKKIGEGDNSTDELATTQSTDFFDE